MILQIWKNTEQIKNNSINEGNKGYQKKSKKIFKEKSSNAEEISTCLLLLYSETSAKISIKFMLERQLNQCISVILKKTAELCIQATEIGYTNLQNKWDFNLSVSSHNWLHVMRLTPPLNHHLSDLIFRKLFPNPNYGRVPSYLAL